MQNTTPTIRERQPKRRIVAEVLVVGIVAALLIPVATFAGKGGKGASTGGTVTLTVLDGEDQVANHRDRVTFDVSGAGSRPFVGVRCWQGADWVLDGYVGLFPEYMFDPWVTLDSSYWTAGVDATCTARLFYYDRRGNQKVVATTTFAALQ